MGRLFVVLFCVLAVGACTKKKAASPTAAAPAEKAPGLTEAAPAEQPKIPEEAAPPKADVVQATDTAGDTVEDEPLALGPAKTAEGVVAALEAALDAMAKCDRVTNSHRLKNPSACLSPVYEARVDVRNPSTRVAPDANGRRALRAKLAAIALARLNTKDNTVLLYTLQALGSDFDERPETLARLGGLLDHEIEAIATAAAAARFSKPRVNDKATLTLALSLVDSERAAGVRAAACRYVGDEVFRGRRKHVKLLAERALAKVEASVVRGTAVARLGFVGSDAEVPTLVRLFRVPATQYAAVFTIQQGLRTEKAFEALVTWLEGAAKGDKSIQWGTLSAVVPREMDLAKYPTRRAIKALAAVARSGSQHVRTRAASAEAIGALGGKAALRALAKKFRGSKEPEDMEILSAIEKALGVEATKGAEPAPKP
jgi:hypothetical protein